MGDQIILQNLQKRIYLLEEANRLKEEDGYNTRLQVLEFKILKLQNSISIRDQSLESMKKDVLAIVMATTSAGQDVNNLKEMLLEIMHRVEEVSNNSSTMQGTLSEIESKQETLSTIQSKVNDDWNKKIEEKKCDCNRMNLKHLLHGLNGKILVIENKFAAISKTVSKLETEDRSSSESADIDEGIHLDSDGSEQKERQNTGDKLNQESSCSDDGKDEGLESGDTEENREHISPSESPIELESLIDDRSSESLLNDPYNINLTCSSQSIQPDIRDSHTVSESDLNDKASGVKIDVCNYFKDLGIVESNDKNAILEKNGDEKQLLPTTSSTSTPAQPVDTPLIRVFNKPVIKLNDSNKPNVPNSNLIGMPYPYMYPTIYRQPFPYYSSIPYPSSAAQIHVQPPPHYVHGDRIGLTPGSHLTITNNPTTQRCTVQPCLSKDLKDPSSDLGVELPGLGVQLPQYYESVSGKIVSTLAREVALDSSTYQLVFMISLCYREALLAKAELASPNCVIRPHFDKSSGEMVLEVSLSGTADQVRSLYLVIHLALAQVFTEMKTKTTTTM